MLIVDAHQDLAWNMLTFNRDYTRSAQETRRQELGSFAQLYNDDTVLGWPEYQRGRVAVVFASLFALPARLRVHEWDILSYTDIGQARRLYSAQLDAYERLVDDHPEKFRLLHTRPALVHLLSSWSQAPGDKEEVDCCAVGLVLSMEGAEAVGKPPELEEWWVRGVRIVGPAWAGNLFCGGTNEPGGLTSQGFALLDAMAGLGFALDLSHMDELAAMQALDVYPGVVIASHSNARALLKDYDGNRHLSDRLIQGLLERDGVVGVVPFNSFLKPGWKRGESRQEIGLQYVVAQIDYICQIAGDASHVGIGSDFDGGFGLQSIPEELDSIADLVKLAPLLAERGYSEKDIDAILGENWLDRLRDILPDSV